MHRTSCQNYCRLTFWSTLCTIHISFAMITESNTTRVVIEMMKSTMVCDLWITKLTRLPIVFQFNQLNYGIILAKTLSKKVISSDEQKYNIIFEAVRIILWRNCYSLFWRTWGSNEYTLPIFVLVSKIMECNITFSSCGVVIFLHCVLWISICVSTLSYTLSLMDSAQSLISIKFHPTIH